MQEKSKTKHLPMQFNTIKEEAHAQMRQGFARRAVEELPG